MKDKDEIPISLTYQGMLNRIYTTPKHKLSDDDILMDKMTRVVKDFNTLDEFELRNMKSLIEKSEFNENLESHLKSIESALKQKQYEN
ncbi:hypothetical protein [uncultured Lutibacter sp.]|uniref:hypothetical protein n=1 Tax=uncultured Lutibacter sp. TaxID=437739 RepID=UPI00260B8F5D|nr:hypothetical protein [uncultured Lutibacter sp.]